MFFEIIEIQRITAFKKRNYCSIFYDISFMSEKTFSKNTSNDFTVEKPSVAEFCVNILSVSSIKGKE